MKPAYKVVDREGMESHIVKVDVTDVSGVSWREAKKQLRNVYLVQAASLRQLKEKDVV